jgi:deoxyribodipyrimidine photolyase-related protein
MSGLRHLVVVLGDQLDRDSAAFDGFERATDAVLMMEVAEEAEYVPQHKIRLALFFSAMRHCRDDLRARGVRVHYSELDERANRGSLGGELERIATATRPERLIVLKPGDQRVEQALRASARSLGCPLEIRDDRHFLWAPDAFAEFAGRRRSLVLETFYRQMRRRHGVLMDGDRLAGGSWNFDPDNRASFGRDGPGPIKPPRAFRHDAVTRQVLALVERRFGDHPGTLEGFDYPVTREQARAALRDFVEHRLEHFGRYQDAMASGRPYLYHSRLSCVLNLHLLDPRAAIEAAVAAWREGRAPLNSVEGFVRQIFGWREYVRGIYWLKMPAYAALNALGAELPMPALMWTGECEMNCIRQCVGQLRRHA